MLFRSKEGVYSDFNYRVAVAPAERRSADYNSSRNNLAWNKIIGKNITDPERSFSGMGYSRLNLRPGNCPVYSLMTGHKNKTHNPASQRKISGSPPKIAYKNTTGLSTGGSYMDNTFISFHNSFNCLSFILCLSSIALASV